MSTIINVKKLVRMLMLSSIILATTGCDDVTLNEAPELILPPPLMPITENSSANVRVKIPIKPMLNKISQDITKTPLSTVDDPVAIDVFGFNFVFDFDILKKCANTPASSIPPDLSKIIFSVITVPFDFVRICPRVSFAATPKIRYINFSENDQRLRVDINIDLNGSMNVRTINVTPLGPFDRERKVQIDLSKFILFGMDSNPVESNFTVSFELQPTLDKNWCPKFNWDQNKIALSWNKPFVVYPDLLWFQTLFPEAKIGKDIKDAAEGDVKKNVGISISKVLSNAIKCDLVKNAMEQFYGKYDINIPISSIGGPSMANVNGLTDTLVTNTNNTTPSADLVPGVFKLSIDPQEFSLAPRILFDKDLNLMVDGGAAVAIKTTLDSEVSNKGFTWNLVENKPLPLLSYIDPLKQNSFKLKLPLVVGYESLSKIVKHLLPKSNLATGLNLGMNEQFYIEDVKIYPNGHDRLAIGIRFRSYVSFLGDKSPDGWVYLTAKPVYNPDNQTLTFEDLVYTQKLDEAMWNQFAPILDKELKKAISNVKVDLSSLRKTADDSVKSALVNFLKLDANRVQTNTQLTLDYILLSDKGLVTHATFQSDGIDGFDRIDLSSFGIDGLMMNMPK